MNIVPKNLISPFEQNNLLQVLFLALFFGMVLVKSAENVAPVRQSVVVLKNFFS